MPNPECKVYFDGSHYIAIPHTERKTRRRPKPPEEYITVEEEQEPQEETSEAVETVSEPAPTSDQSEVEEVNEAVNSEPQTPHETVKGGHKMTKKELFNQLYAENINVTKSKRRKMIVAAMLPYFKSETDCEYYVDMNFERKQRNLIARRIRLTRKVNLCDFNYFVTFTYNGELHDEQSFKKGLKKTLSNFVTRKQWRYVGVWERSPKKKRLHFHGLFHIPAGTMPGLMIEVNDYNFHTHKRQITHQNTYFNDKFGRSDFETIDDQSTLGNAVTYIMKYIEKTGEKIVYSKGLYQFFISDIMDEDVICPIGLEDKKLLLYDDFCCIDEGTILGRVSKDAIRLMRKCN